MNIQAYNLADGGHAVKRSLERGKDKLAERQDWRKDKKPPEWEFL
jgi:hypothetical protein